MTITIAGLGMGDSGSLTAETREALLSADCIVGAPRLLERLPEGCTAERHAFTRPDAIADFVNRALSYKHMCLVFSGDTGFYSGAKGLAERLVGHDIRILPGISSVQVMAARLGRPWQDMHLVSAHAAEKDPIPHVMNHKTTFFLTGSSGPAALCTALHEAGMDHVHITVGEALGSLKERIVKGFPASFTGEEFDSLSVLVADNPTPLTGPVTQGLPDSAFIRGEVPMTKQAVRAVSLAKLGIMPDDTLWDIGAGTGSVAVEMALQARYGRVYAIEREAGACDLIRQNSARFGTHNLRIRNGKAPEALAGLPTPDAVFIGGSGGRLYDIAELLVAANPRVRVVVTAIALETLQEARDILGKAPFVGLEVMSLSVAEAKQVGSYHMMMGQNPIYVLSAKAGDGGER